MRQKIISFSIVGILSAFLTAFVLLKFMHAFEAKKAFTIQDAEAFIRVVGCDRLKIDLESAFSQAGLKKTYLPNENLQERFWPDSLRILKPDDVYINQDGIWILKMNLLESTQFRRVGLLLTESKKSDDSGFNPICPQVWHFWLPD